MKKITVLLLFLLLLLLSGCDTGEEDIVRDIKHDISIEYGVPITDIEVETIEYGITIFSTNQFKVVIKSKDISFYLVDMKNNNTYTRFPISINE